MNEKAREAAAEALAAHQVRAWGMTHGSPDRCHCGAASFPGAGDEDVRDRRARAFAAHQADAVLSAAEPILRDEVLRESTRVAAGLYLLLYDAHRAYANTTTWRGGIGGQAITTGCAILDPAPDQHWAQMDLPSKPLREWLNEHPDIDINAAADDLRQELLRDLEGEARP